LDASAAFLQPFTAVRGTQLEAWDSELGRDATIGGALSSLNIIR